MRYSLAGTDSTINLMKRTLSRLHAFAPLILLVLIASVVVVLFVGAYYSTQEANAYTYDIGSCNAFNPCSAEFKCASAANFGSCVAGYIGSNPWSSGVYPPKYPSCATSAYPTESAYNACGAAITPAAVTVTPSEGSSIPLYTYPDGIPPSYPTVSYSASASGGSAPYTYAWYVGSSASGPVAGTISTFDQTYTTTGTKYVTVVVTTSTGKQTTVTRSIQIVQGENNGTHYQEGLHTASLTIGNGTYISSISANKTTIAPGEPVVLTYTVSTPYCAGGSTPTSYNGMRASTYAALYPDSGSDLYYTSPHNINLASTGCSGGRNTYTGTQTVYPTATTPWALNFWMYEAGTEGSCVGVGGGCWFSLEWWLVKAYTPAFTITVPAQPPTATLTASPTSIAQGNSSILTWSSTNTTSCVGTSFSTGGQTGNPSPASTSVTPGSTTNYSVTCTGPGGSANASASVTVIPALAATCSVSPTSIPNGGSATWTAIASGGTGTYAYSWSGTDSLSGSGASVTKTYASVGTHTASITVTSGSQNRTVACSNSLSVGPAPAADLTAGATSVPAATAGTPVTFSANASNIGTGASGSFPTRFQVANQAITSTVGNTSSGYITLAAGASQGRTAPYTFASAGTYNVRACANQTNDGSTNIVTESNYANNCGPWTQVSVSAAASTGSLSCNVSNRNPAPGTTVTYTAIPSNGASGPFSWNDTQGGSYGTGASVQRLIPGAGPYVMSVNGQNVISPATCPVVGGTCANASASISASPNRVREGQTTTVTWSATGVDSSCTITGPGVNQSVTGASCVIPNGSATPTINAQSVYRISCDNGETVDEVVVNLIPGFIEF